MDMEGFTIFPVWMGMKMGFYVPFSLVISGVAHSVPLKTIYKVRDVATGVWGGRPPTPSSMLGKNDMSWSKMNI